VDVSIASNKALPFTRELNGRFDVFVGRSSCRILIIEVNIVSL